MANNCRKCGQSMIDEFVLLNLEEEEPQNMASFNRSLEHIEYVHSFVESGKANEREKLELLCLSCLKLVIDQLKNNVIGEENDQNALISRIKSLQQQKHLAGKDLNVNNNNLSSNIITMEKISKEQQEVLNELEKLQKENEQLTLEWRKTQSENIELEKEENSFWSSMEKFEIEQQASFEEQELYDTRNLNFKSLLDSLQQHNVYRDVFSISISTNLANGTLGSINRLRLGRPKDNSFDWEETNAALGHVVLALTVIIRKLGFKTTRFELRPMSNRSSVHNKQDNTVYYLYGTSDHRFGTSWFWSNDNRFEGGLIAFLECLHEAIQVACMQHPPLKDKVGQITEGHKIGDKANGFESVKLEGNSEENWNAAMNNILKTVNRLLAYVSRQEKNQPPPILVHHGTTAQQTQTKPTHQQTQTQTQQTTQVQTQSAQKSPPTTTTTTTTKK